MDCLVNMLKATSNLDLLKVNEIRFRIETDKLGINCIEAGKIYAINGTTFPDNSTEKNLSAGWNYIQAGENPFIASMDKTNIVDIECNSNYHSIVDKLVSEPGVFDSISSISGLNLDYYPIISESVKILGTAKASKIMNFNPADSYVPNLKTIFMENYSKDYTLSAYCKYTELTLLCYLDSNTSGEIKDFLSGQVDNGRNSGQIRIITNSKTTLDGVYTVNDSIVYANFGSSMVNPTQEETERGWQITNNS